MHRVVVSAFGGPDQLCIQTTSEELRFAPNQILVDVEAAGVNYVDIYQRQGASAQPAPLPYTPRLEGVGRVRQI